VHQIASGQNDRGAYAEVIIGLRPMSCGRCSLCTRPPQAGRKIFHILLERCCERVCVSVGADRISAAESNEDKVVCIHSARLVGWLLAGWSVGRLAGAARRHAGWFPITIKLCSDQLKLATTNMKHTRSRLYCFGIGFCTNSNKVAVKIVAHDTLDVSIKTKARGYWICLWNVCQISRFAAFCWYDFGKQKLYISLTLVRFVVNHVEQIMSQNSKQTQVGK
jgi:hypothetical protein